MVRTYANMTGSVKTSLALKVLYVVAGFALIVGMHFRLW